MDTTSGIVIASISTPILLSAFETADGCATKAARSSGGWVRLARYQGTAKEPYVIAVRKVDTSKGVQFSCSCPDFKFRKSQMPGHALCKHQRHFFEQCASTPKKFWFYNSGKMFCMSVLSQIVRNIAALPLCQHNPDEQAA